MLPNSTASVRPIYGGPACNYAGCVDIGVLSQSARLAFEPSLGLAVGLGDVAARRASSAAVARIDEHDGNPDKPALVSDLFSEIRECPRMQDTPLAFSSSDPSANVAKIFHRYSTSGAFSLGANLFRNNVIGMVDESVLTSTKTIQNTASGLRPFALKSLPLTPPPRSDPSDFLRVAIRPTVRVGCDTNQSKVDPKPKHRFSLLGVWNFDGDMQKPHSAMENESRFPALQSKELAVSFGANERQFLDSTFYGPNVDRRFAKIECKNPLVIGNRTVTAKSPARLRIKLIGFRHFRNQSNDRLGSQRGKRSPDPLVERLVHREMAEFLSVPRKTGKIITSRVDRFESLLENASHMGRRQEFDRNRQNHGRIIFKPMNLSICG